MTLLERAVRRPVLVIMAFSALVLFGGYALTRLPIDQMPEIEPPVLTVVTIYPGAGAEDVETKVTNLLERSLSSLPGLDQMSSSSKENLSMITLTMDQGTDLEATVNEVRQQLDFVKNSLPDEARKPWILKFSSSMLPVYILAVKANRGDLQAYRQLIKERLINRLERIPGVGNTMMLNAPKREVVVEVDRKQLQDRDLSLLQLVKVLEAQNLSVPAGRMQVGDLDLPVSVPGDYQTLEQIRWTLVGMGAAPPLAGAQRAEIPDPFYLALSQIYLKDVADVKVGLPERRTIAKHGAKEAIWVMVFKKSGANTIDVVTRVKENIGKFQAGLPPGLEIVPLLDGSEFIRATVDNLTQTVLIGGVLVLVVVLLFLRRLRPSLVVAVAIPASMIAVFAGMYLMEYTINAVSLIAMALAIGMVVDAAIVVLESIARRVEEGEPPVDAAVNGTREVAAAVFASILTSVVIFAPLLFVRGFIGVMLGQLVFVMIFTLSASLLTALVLTPTLAARLVKPTPPAAPGARVPIHRRVAGGIERGFRGVERGYAWLLGKALRWRLVVVLLALGILGGSAVLVLRTGVDFVLADDYGFVQVIIELPQGTRLEKTAEAADEIAGKLRSFDEVRMTFWNAGTSESGVMSSSGGKEGINIATIMCRLVGKDQRERSEEDVVDELRPWVKKRYPNAVVTYRTGNPMGATLMGSDKPITLNLKGDDFQDLKVAARRVERMLADIEGTKDVSAELLDTKPDFRIMVDRKRAAKMGLSSMAIGATLRAALHGWKAGEYRAEKNPMDIMVRLRKEDRKNPADLERLLIPNMSRKHVSIAGQTVHGGSQTFPLANFARIIRGRSPIEIKHMDKERVVKVGAGYRDRALGDVLEDVDLGLASLELPKGVTIEQGSEAKRQKETQADLTWVLIFSLILVYMVMSGQFESLLDPFVIMFSVPFALTGVFLTFLVTGTKLSIPAFTGLIVLVGVVVNNAIVLIDYVNQLRAEGASRDEAIQRAGERRLRPVLMTAFTTIMGMLPLALSTKEGAYIWSPLGQAVVGGLLVSTLVTLVVVPVIYSLLEPLRRRHKRAAATTEHEQTADASTSDEAPAAV
jgi:HAE1 family hydrophobic/amphiphilic exporter-1